MQILENTGMALSEDLDQRIFQLHILAKELGQAISVQKYKHTNLAVDKGTQIFSQMLQVGNRNLH